MKKKTIIFSMIGVILVIGIVALSLYLKSVKNYKDTVKAMIIQDVDLTNVPDGTYTGECNVDIVYAKVKVTVKDQAITNIDLVEHKNGKGKPAERIVDDIVKEQSVKVDTVSGATNSSKVIMKAVENALTPEVKK
jgi:uncharacterized protein with FMN-binding domain